MGDTKGNGLMRWDRGGGIEDANPDVSMQSSYMIALVLTRPLMLLLLLLSLQSTIQ